MSQLDQLSTLLNGAHCVAVESGSGASVRVDDDFVPVVAREDTDTGLKNLVRPEYGIFLRAFQGGGALRVETVQMTPGGFQTRALALKEGDAVLSHLLEAARKIQEVISRTA